MIVKHLLIPTWDPTFTAARGPPTSAPNIGSLDQDAFAIDSKSWALLPALGATFQVSHRWNIFGVAAAIHQLIKTVCLAEPEHIWTGVMNAVLNWIRGALQSINKSLRWTNLPTCGKPPHVLSHQRRRWFEPCVKMAGNYQELPSPVASLTIWFHDPLLGWLTSRQGPKLRHPMRSSYISKQRKRWKYLRICSIYVPTEPRHLQVFFHLHAQHPYPPERTGIRVRASRLCGKELLYAIILLCLVTKPDPCFMPST